MHRLATVRRMCHTKSVGSRARSMPDRPTERLLATCTVVWSAGYAGFAGVCLVRGAPVFAIGRDVAPVSLNWIAVFTAALAAWAVLRTGRVPRLVLWTCAAVSALSAFGLLMDVVTLVFNQRPDNAVLGVHHALSLAGAVLLASSAHMRAARPSCRTDAPASSATLHRVAWTGAAALVPYAAMKLTWTWGGTFAGLSGVEMRSISERNGASDLWLTLEDSGIDPTVLVAVAGVVLLVALVGNWGRRLPRWVLLTPAVIGVSTLLPYGTVGLGYAVAATAGPVTPSRGDFHTAADALLVTWIGLGSFWTYGLCLAVATHAYWRGGRAGKRPGARARGASAPDSSSATAPSTTTPPTSAPGQSGSSSRVAPSAAPTRGVT